MNRPRLSIVIPVRDEEENLEMLFDEIEEVFSGENLRFEVIAVDDGSGDRSGDVLKQQSERRPWLRVIRFDQHRGQTAALFTGWKAARGELLASLDADLQNDPRDLLLLLERVEEESGVDMITGIRANRKDTFWKRLQSRIGNRVRDVITGDRITDTGCSVRLMKRECAEALPLLDGMHRFIPTLVRMRGFEVAEMPVTHRPRNAGVTKYGASNRALRGLIDCLVVRWMRTRTIRGGGRGEDS